MKQSVPANEYVFIKEVFIGEAEAAGLKIDATYYSSDGKKFPLMLILNAHNRRFLLPLCKEHVDKIVEGLREIQQQPVVERIAPTFNQMLEHKEEMDYDRDKA